MSQSWCDLTFLHWRYPVDVVRRQVPPLSQFAETNCRTYVSAPDKPGVWFFSLDAVRILAVMGARLAYGLPLRLVPNAGTAKRRRIIYESARRWPDSRSRTRIVVEPGAKVDHPPWPLRRARVVESHQTLTEEAGLSQPLQAGIGRYSPGVNVRIGSPELV